MSAYQLQVIENGKPKRKDSAALQLDLSSVRIGASLLEILENAGNFAFSNKRLTGIASPTASDHAATKGYVDLQVAALGTAAEWQSSVLTSSLTTPPGSPSVGDRYLIGLNTGAGAALGAWAGKDGQIAEWNGSAWVFSVPTPGTFTSADDADTSLLYFGGTVWTQKYFESTTAGDGLQKIGFEISVKLESSTPTLEILGAGELAVKLSASGAIVKGADGLELNLQDTNPSLEISGNKLAVKVDPAGAIVKTASGIKANIGNGIEISSNALRAKAGDSTVKVDSAGIKTDFSEDLTNDNAGAITALQFVYMKSNGAVDLAMADNTAFNLGTIFGCVLAASIAAAAAGEIAVRPGAKISGFTGLTPNAPVYLSRSVAGGYQQDLSGFVEGEQVVFLGYALSATELQFEPKFLYEN